MCQVRAPLEQEKKISYAHERINKALKAWGGGGGPVAGQYALSPLLCNMWAFVSVMTVNFYATNSIHMHLLKQCFLNFQSGRCLIFLSLLRNT